MRLINDGTWQRIQLLSITLEELDNARVELLRRLEDLDARARTVRLERNTLQNSAAPISILPEDVLAMIFEAGMRQGNDRHFGILVSHVTRRWRNLALGTPRLWTNIRCTQPEEDSELYGLLDGDRWMERTATFLARSGSLPIDISILRFRDEDISQEFVELIGNHMGHCRQLRIKAPDTPSLKFLGYLFTKPAPNLSSIDLSSGEDLLEFSSELFPLGAPRLTHVELEGIEPFKLLPLVPGFQSVTSMRLTTLYFSDSRDRPDAYHPFRQCLMAMKSLIHLEVHLWGFQDRPHRLPIVLPTLQLLLIAIAHTPCHLSALIKALRAPSMRTISLSAWDETIPDHLDVTDIRVHFPSLQHLILNDVSKAVPSLALIARTFPDIERLTCQVVPSPATANSCGIEHILAAVVEGAMAGARVAQDGGYNQAVILPRWCSLKSIAMTTDVPFNAIAVEDLLRKLQDIGHPLAKLMLPEILFSQAGTEAMTQLGQFIEFENYGVNWPIPFACCACGSHARFLHPTCRKNCFYSDRAGSRPWESDTNDMSTS